MVILFFLFIAINSFIILFYTIIGIFNIYAVDLEIEDIGKNTTQISIDWPRAKDIYPFDMKVVLKVL